ncbi:MAG: hypothetical protein AAF518_28690 [Spirochaetota bacterium]
MDDGKEDSASQNQYLNEIIKSLETMNERILSALDDVEVSNIFLLTGDPSENKNIIGNFKREFSHDIVFETNSIREKYNEILSYPREMKYYVAQYSLGKQSILHQMPNDDERYNRILRWELTERLQQNSLSLRKMLYNLLTILNMKKENESELTDNAKRELFQGAKNSILFCIQGISVAEEKLQNWQKNYRD